MSSSEDEDSVFKKEVYKEMGEDRDKEPLQLLDEICSMLEIKKETLVRERIKNLRLKIQELEFLLEKYRPE